MSNVDNPFYKNKIEVPRLGFEPKSEAPQASRISKLPYRGMVYRVNGVNSINPSRVDLHLRPTGIGGWGENFEANRRSLEKKRMWILALSGKGTVG